MAYSPDPQTTKRNRAKSQGPTGDPSSCAFWRNKSSCFSYGHGYQVTDETRTRKCKYQVCQAHSFEGKQTGHMDKYN